MHPGPIHTAHVSGRELPFQGTREGQPWPRGLSCMLLEDMG